VHLKQSHVYCLYTSPLLHRLQLHALELHPGWCSGWQVRDAAHLQGEVSRVVLGHAEEVLQPPPLDALDHLQAAHFSKCHSQSYCQLNCKGSNFCTVRRC
jgi:hypothetical protein